MGIPVGLFRKQKFYEVTPIFDCWLCDKNLETKNKPTKHQYNLHAETVQNCIHLHLKEST